MINKHITNILLLLRSDDMLTKAELHEKLIAVLMDGFLNKKTDIINWTRQFRLICPNPKIVDGPIKDHFNYLEEEVEAGLKIGQYKVLRDIFKSFNVKAIEFIDDQAEKINAPAKLNDKS